jgi:uncharacterized protein
MLEQLFGSKTRLKLLKLFFQHPDRTFFVRELQRLLDTQINAIRREIKILIDVKLIVEIEKEEVDKRRTTIEKAQTKITSGSTLRKYYQLNKQSILFEEMHNLLLKAQVLGEQQLVDDIKEKGGEINLLLLTGRFTGEFDAPSDILLVGNIKERSIAKIISEHEKTYNIEVRYTVMTAAEFLERRHILDKFLFSLFEGKHMKVVDTF